MRKILMFLAVAAFLISCNSYGDKVQIHKSEVYYKDGATKEEAQKLGDFLLKNNYFDSSSRKSVQLTKNIDTFNIKLVVNKEKVDQEKSAEFLFQILAAAASSEVFNNRPVKIILADQTMKGFRNIPPFSTPAPTGTTGNTNDTTTTER